VGIVATMSGVVGEAIHVFHLVGGAFIAVGFWVSTT
jgi:hypothetical protein